MTQTEDLLDFLARRVECNRCPCFALCQQQKPKMCKEVLAQRILIEIAGMLKTAGKEKN